MIKDELVMDNETGELIPATEAIRLFYQTHGIKEAWTDAYTPTGMDADNELPPPDFINVF